MFYEPSIHPPKTMPQVALCTSPLLHRNLSLSDRCELSLAGFLVLDLYRMYAESECSKATKGSFFMAPQTMFNLQGVALSTALITISKDDHFHPWKVGTVRMSEMAVEEWFGLQRKQSANSQLSARGFWKAGARTQLHHGKLLNKEKCMQHKPEPCLTEEQSLGKIDYVDASTVASNY